MVGGAQIHNGKELSPATFFAYGMAVWMRQPEYKSALAKEHDFNAKPKPSGQPDDLASLLANLFEL